MNLLSLSKRTVAYIVLKVSGTLGGGAVIGVEVWQAALLAGFIGFMEVAEEVSRAYVKDGDVSEEDMNDIFNDFDEVEDMDSEA
jgi:hypothetical protein